MANKIRVRYVRIQLQRSKQSLQNTNMHLTFGCLNGYYHWATCIPYKYNLCCQLKKPKWFFCIDINIASQQMILVSVWGQIHMAVWCASRAVFFVIRHQVWAWHLSLWWIFCQNWLLKCKQFWTDCVSSCLVVNVSFKRHYFTLKKYSM